MPPRLLCRLLVGLALVWPTMAGADTCTGRNLIAALPPAELATLRAEAEVPYAIGNLWTATRNGAQITLVGTFHLDDPRFDAMVARLAPLLDSATALLVEAGPAEETDLKDAMTRDPALIYVVKGPTLPERMTPAEWALLSDALRARGMAPFMAAKLQPWLVASLLGVPACKFPVNANVAQGLDKRLIARALARGLPIVALEPYDTIIGIFAQFTPDDQLAMLTQTVALDASSDDMATTLADSYFAGQSRLFWAYSASVTLKQPGMTPEKTAADMALIDRAMISVRNAAWIPVLEKAAAKGPVLAAFGALHLPAETGVLNLLAKNGWAITALIK